MKGRILPDVIEQVLSHIIKRLNEVVLEAPKMPIIDGV
jgi:hypothetical protein